MKIWLQKPMLILIWSLALVVGLPVAAATLDENATKLLITDRVWQQKQHSASGYNYWSWKADASVCLRLEDIKSKCVDTGHWKLNANRLCYELTWWGASQGKKAVCFRISDRGNGQYAAIQDNGLTLYEFSVVKK